MIHVQIRAIDIYLAWTTQANSGSIIASIYSRTIKKYFKENLPIKCSLFLQDFLLPFQGLGVKVFCVNNQKN